MEDLKSIKPSVYDLIAQALDQRENERIRAQKQWTICYVGDRKHGDYAVPPNASNTVWIKAGDPLPEGNKHYAHTEDALRAWFDACTIKTGPNVWRWELNKFERILLGQ